MIIVKVSDGLGNQIFQYAFARMLAEKTNHKVYLDRRFINNEDVFQGMTRYRWNRICDRRVYGLDNLNISLTTMDDAHILNKWDIGGTNDFRKYLKLLKVDKYVKLNESDLLSGHIKINRWQNFYITGYFFKKTYYEELIPILKKELKEKEKINLSVPLRQVMDQKNTVGIHIRRGDFLKVGRNFSESQYYQRAVAYIKEYVEDPYLLMFSDDIPWVREHFRLDIPVIYVSEEGYKDYEEMMIFSRCKHNIITNSTFSYWGAVINEHENKIVIVPKGWNEKVVLGDWIAI